MKALLAILMVLMVGCSSGGSSGSGSSGQTDIPGSSIPAPNGTATSVDQGNSAVTHYC